MLFALYTKDIGVLPQGIHGHAQPTVLIKNYYVGQKYNRLFNHPLKGMSIKCFFFQYWSFDMIRCYNVRLRICFIFFLTKDCFVYPLLISKQLL